jgi:hypothetical protein
VWIAFLDSNVLFPVFISNLLLFLSETELFAVRWSRDVHREWIDAFTERYPDADRAALERKRSRMDREFPDALVEGYEPLIDHFHLPDSNDNHIAAAADRAGANVIVTDNIDDFPTHLLCNGLFAQTADDFIADQFYLTGRSARLVATALIRHKKSLNTSRPNWCQYFDQLRLRLPQSFNLANETTFRSLIGDVLQSGDWRFE